MASFALFGDSYISKLAKFCDHDLKVSFALSLSLPWGLDSQNSPCPQDLDRRLWHRGGTLDVSARKS